MHFLKLKKHPNKNPAPLLQATGPKFNLF